MVLVFGGPLGRMWPCFWQLQLPLLLSPLLQRSSSHWPRQQRGWWRQGVGSAGCTGSSCVLQHWPCQQRLQQSDCAPYARPLCQAQRVTPVEKAMALVVQFEGVCFAYLNLPCQTQPCQSSNAQSFGALPFTRKSTATHFDTHTHTHPHA